MSVLHIAETVKRLCGSSSDIVFTERPVDDPNIRQPDISLAKRELGWEPTVGFEDGLERTVAYFRQLRAEEEALLGGLVQRAPA